MKGAVLRVLDAADAASLVGEETLRLRLGHDLGQVAVGVLMTFSSASMSA